MFSELPLRPLSALPDRIRTLTSPHPTAARDVLLLGLSILARELPEIGAAMQTAFHGELGTC